MSIQSRDHASAGFGPVFFLCLVLLLSGGCARQPWTQPVDDKQAQAIRDMLREKSKTEAACPSTLDAAVTFSMKTIMVVAMIRLRQRLVGTH